LRPLSTIYSEIDRCQKALRVIPEDDPRTPKLVQLYHALLEEGSEQDRWLFCRYLARTQDEHDETNPFKLFPDMKYLEALVRKWEAVAKAPSNRVLFIHKSRQVMASHTANAMVLWSALFEKGRTIGWQSKKSEDANWMLKRIYGLWERLPNDVRRRHPCEAKEGELRFGDRGNTIMGIPEGPEKPRQFTWSLFVSDEMAFQERARETYVAVQPAIRGGGMYVGISSAAPGFFMRFVEDLE
jgi:hypothetical protein